MFWCENHPKRRPRMSDFDRSPDSKSTNLAGMMPPVCCWFTESTSWFCASTFASVSLSWERWARAAPVWVKDPVRRRRYSLWWAGTTDSPACESTVAPEQTAGFSRMTRDTLICPSACMASMRFLRVKTHFCHKVSTFVTTDDVIQNMFASQQSIKVCLLCRKATWSGSSGFYPCPSSLCFSWPPLTAGEASGRSGLW